MVLVFRVTLLRSIKSIQILNSPFFLNIGTIFEIQSTYMVVLKNFAFNNLSISSLILSITLGTNLRGAYFIGLFPQ